MQAAPPTPSSPTRARRNSTQIPRLSYRNSISGHPSQLPPQGATVAKSPTSAEVPTSAGSDTGNKKSSSTGRQAESGNTLTPTTSRGNDRSLNSSKSLISPTTQKKKSLFGGLFVTKEPTAIALEKLAAQLEAQHGELSARAIPGVSSSKLPEHVPKVNTKWDGVPEAVKEREKVRKEKARVAKRKSLELSTRSRSAEGFRQANVRPGERRPVQKMTSSSTLSSFGSRGRTGHQGHSQFSSSDGVRSSSKTPSSSTDLRQRSDKPPSTKSQSLRSPSGSSLPHITAFFPNDTGSPNIGPTSFDNEGDRVAGSQTTTSTGWTRLNQAGAFPEATIDMMPDHTLSPIGTPYDRSPVTPSSMVQNHPSREPSILPIWNRTEEAIFPSSGPDVLGPPTTAIIRRKHSTPRHAFLAGEAKPFELPDEDSHLPLRHMPNRNSKAPELPAHLRVQQDLEKRPDSSRTRLGLRASMVVRADQAPWDWQDFDKGSDSDRSSSPRLSMPVVPRGLSKVLGKPNK